jgi:hypothetical protein
MKKKVVYVDMDGVLCDFDEQCRRCGIDSQAMSRNEFWRQIRTKGITFWSDMPPLLCEDHLKFVWSELKRMFDGNVSILSSPDKGNLKVSEAGKSAWIDKHLGPMEARLFLLDKSEILEDKPESILIDDRESVIEAWEKKGGVGVLHDGDWQVTFDKLVTL